jgi:uncharacterized membrane-anchored protein
MSSPEKEILRVFVLLISIACLQLTSAAQGSQKTIDWKAGPTVGKLGDIAQISLPSGYKFTGKVGTETLFELTQNPSDGNELGAVIPVLGENDDIWFVVFEFESSGYVRDTEKDSLDANAIFASIRDATEESNKLREQKGWAPFHVTGWSQRPFYDSRTNNLTWAILGSTQTAGKPAEQVVNYSVRLLGRQGVMRVDLVLSPGQVAEVLPQFEKLLNGFSFVPGQAYSDWRSGDKVAKYGLTALIVGGAAAAAVKTGLLFKFWKLIVAGFLALVAFLKRAFNYMKRVLTGKAGDETPQQE